jgi:hypothetical protein
MESAAARQGDRLVLVGLPDGSALSASHTAETTATPAPSVYVRRCERANWHLAPSPAMPDIEIAEMPRTLPDPATWRGTGGSMCSLSLLWDFDDD